MHRTIAINLLLVAWLPMNIGAQDDAVLRVQGRGVEGKMPYRGGGVVRFLDASLGAQIVHYDGGERIPLPLELSCEVLEAAPIQLTSRMGTEYWRLYSFANETMSAMYTDERIDLCNAGKHQPKTTRAWFNSRYGPLPGKGLVGLRGHYYLLIDQPDSHWLDVVDPPAWFDRPELARKLTFTLADLSKFSLSVSKFQSTWQPGGVVRVQVTVTDAQGQTLPIVNAPVRAASETWETELSTEWGPLNEPTGWLRGTLPKSVPDQLAVRGTVTLQLKDALKMQAVAADFAKGDGQTTERELRVAQQGYELPRGASGTIRETRAIWVSTSDIASSDGIDALVKRCKWARLNVIVPDIFVRNTFMARSSLIPTSPQAQGPPDRLAYLIEQAHAAGLEVHPWFCVTYRDAAFRAWFQKRFRKDVTMIDGKGNPIPLGADVHRPEYRQFITDLMIGVARDYGVDGIHLDYIRAMNQCFCPQCQTEFARQFGNELAEATEEQWTQWQRQAIGDIVQRTAAGVRQVRPNALMSAAVFANMTGGALQGQDPAGWVRQGWMDLIFPMDYQMQTLQVRANERQFLKVLEDDNRLVSGLSLYMRSGGEVFSRPPELVHEQIELIRSMGIHGYCLFAYGHLSDAQVQMLRDQVNAEEAVPYSR